MARRPRFSFLCFFHEVRRPRRRSAVGAAERRVTFRAPSLICFRTSSASLSPWGDRKEMTIVLPPVEPDLLRLGDGAHGHPNAHCEELDLGDRDANVAGDGKALVEHAVENIDGAVGPMTGASLRTFPPRSRQRERNRRVEMSAPWIR